MCHALIQTVNIIDMRINGLIFEYLIVPYRCNTRVFVILYPAVHNTLKGLVYALKTFCGIRGKEMLTGVKVIVA